jgi:hypothetical protein
VGIRQEDLLRDFNWRDGSGRLEKWRRKHAGVQVQEDIGTRLTNVEKRSVKSLQRERTE